MENFWRMWQAHALNIDDWRKPGRPALMKNTESDEIHEKLVKIRLSNFT